MSFSHQTKGSIAQVLSVISTKGTEIFFYKHLGVTQVPDIIYELDSAKSETLLAMLSELIGNNAVLYRFAETKWVFKNAVAELSRWAFHDGWVVEDSTLVRIMPDVEETTGIRDIFLENIASSGLDDDGSIRTAIENSSNNFISEPPDYNGSTTNIRIALETVARKAAKAIANRNSDDYQDENWGKALNFLCTSGVIERKEEEILARTYTFISPGAHIPKGLTEEEWARLARTFGLSSAYFLLQKYIAA